MSLLDELTNRGLTAEDLEKAASVRLFEQDCAAENIDLNEMADDDIEELYAHWLTLGEDGGEKAAESDEPTQAEVDEATAKLAEAEYLGRHMARAFNDEAQKIAAMDDQGNEVKSAVKSIVDDKGTKHHTGATGKAKDALLTAKGKVTAGANAAKGKVLRHPKAFMGGAGAAIAAGGFMAGRKSNASKTASAKETAMKHLRTAGAASRLKGMGEKTAGAASRLKGMGEKTASFDALVEQYASEILAENGIELEAEEAETPTIDDIAYARAVELLEENGYSFEE